MGDIQEPRPAGDLSFERVWTMFQEMSKETDRMFKETAERFKETDQKFKETAERIKETDRMIRKMSKETNRKMGELGNRFGELAEHLVAPNILEKFNAMGCPCDAVAPGGLVIRDTEGNALAELDLLLLSSDYVIAVEIKAKLLEKDVDAHSKRLETLRRWVDKSSDSFIGHRKIRGAMAAAIVSDEAQRYALNAGFYTILQTGDTVKIDVPECFVPREW